MVKYKLKKGNILKDGHTMFLQDVVQDLKRKAYLEDLREKEANLSVPFNGSVIKPCPFCGSNAIVTINRGMYRVECLNRWAEEDRCPMNMRTHHMATKEEATASWNKRAI
ncbi:MAG: Lar family restriction alleviation protein [Anaerolineales bacterium]|nr:Lar family restriction alleviation protein [Anaerolineales bacterium]MCK5603547.1 Lar family restriction alleviation protein [Candidatus Pacearchaeota archaeon]